MKYKSIRTKMIRHFSILTFSALLIVVLIFSLITKQEVSKQLQSSAMDILALNQTFLDNTFIEGDSALKLIEDQHLKTPYTQTLLETLSSANPSIKNAFIVHQNGHYMLFPYAQLPREFDPRDREWYENAFNQPESTVWSNPYIDMATNDYVITASRAYFNPSIASKCVIGVDLSLSELSKSINHTSIGDHGFFMMVNEDGTIIAHKDTQFINQNINAIYTVDQTPDALATYQIYTAVNGYFITLPIEKGNFYLTAFIANQDIYAIMQRWMIYLWGTILLVGLGLYIMSRRISDQVTKPLKSLAEAMNQSTHEDMLIFCDATSDDETGFLIERYNDLITKQIDDQSQLSALNEELMASEENLRDQYDRLYTTKEALRYSEEKYRLLFEATTQGLWDIDQDHIFNFYSEKWYEQFDIKIKNSRFNDWTDLIHPDDVEAVNKHFHAHLEGKTDHYTAEYRVRNKLGDYIWVRALAKAQYDEQGQFLTLAGSHKDITEEKHFQEKIIDMAYTDHLTGHHNLYSLKENIRSHMRKHIPLYFYYIDLDNFKYINDTYGHTSGDHVLIVIANRLKMLCGDNMLISRVSGDEFALVYYDPDLSFDASGLADQILETINQPLSINDLEYYVTASVGVSHFPDDADNYDDLLINADMSMYRAKENSKNAYYIFNPEMKHEHLNKMKLESLMLKALEKQEMFVFYQPIVEVDSQSILGFEALIRWRNDTFGMVFPDEFIPMAENNLFINNIGDFVLNDAIIFGLELKEKFGRYFEISVNISPVQLANTDFTSKIAGLLHQYNYPAPYLNLEITESLTLEKNELIQSQIDALIEMGVKLSLDDFGTGYSSLNNLTQIPITHLKIDKSIVQESVAHSDVYKLLESIITFAHHTGLKVISEGIEDEEMLHRIKALGSDYVQGYLFSKPIGKEDCLRLLSHQAL